MFNTVHNDFTIFKHKISISTKYVNGEAANAYQSNAYQLNGTLAHPGIVKDVSCLCFGFIAEIPDTTPLLNIITHIAYELMADGAKIVDVQGQGIRNIGWPPTRWSDHVVKVMAMPWMCMAQDYRIDMFDKPLGNSMSSRDVSVIMMMMWHRY